MEENIYPINEFRHLQSSNPPPGNLWRVQHNESQAQIQDGNIVAVAAPTIATAGEFCQFVQGHLQWGYSLSPSPFLSAFDNYDEALQRAKARHRWSASHYEHARTALYQIDTSQLQGQLVFKVDELRPQLGLNVKRDTSHEYLILNRIPRTAIEFWDDVGAMMARSKASFQVVG